MGDWETFQAKTGGETELPADWKPDITAPWSGFDDMWLDVCLKQAAHFDDGHNPVFCMRNVDGERYEWSFLREESKLTMRELAARIGVDQGTISRWESGKRLPNSIDYERWLTEAGEHHAQEVRMQIFLAQMRRDEWANGWETPGYSMGDHWQAIFGPGRLFDRYLETGALPVWTPRDRGLVSG